MELRQGETTYVSWKKLVKEAASKGDFSSGSGPDPPPPPTNANPNLESRLAPVRVFRLLCYLVRGWFL